MALRKSDKASALAADTLIRVCDIFHSLRPVRASLKVGRGLTSTINSILAARSEKSKGQYHQSVAPRLTYVKEVAGSIAGIYRGGGYIRGGMTLNLR